MSDLRINVNGNSNTVLNSKQNIEEKQQAGNRFFAGDFCAQKDKEGMENIDEQHEEEKEKAEEAAEEKKENEEHLEKQREERKEQQEV